MLRKWYIYICCALTYLTGCTDKQSLPDGTSENVSVVLVVSFGNTQSRVTEDISNDKNIGNEYYINPYDVKVLVFNADGSFKTRAVMTSVSPTSDFTKYILSGMLPSFSTSDIGKQYKLVVLANVNGTCASNYSAFTPITTENELYNELVYEYQDGTSFTEATLNGSSTEGRIPMWGSQTTTIEDGTTIDIYMLRAMSKIEVEIAPETGKTIDKVELANGRKQGKLTPLNAADARATYRVLEDSNADELNAPANLGTMTEHVPFVKGTDGKFYLYIPEQPALDTSKKQEGAQMIVTIGNMEYPLYFANYTPNLTGTGSIKHPVPVLRDHWYTYKITEVLPNNITLKYQVVPWEKNGNYNIEFN